MLIWKKSVPGTVREENQDTVVIHQDQGILILADGSGPNGQQASQQCADFLSIRIQKIRQQASIEHSKERIEMALQETLDQLNHLQSQQHGSPNSTAGLAFACLVEGHLFLGAGGKTGIAAQAGETSITISPANRHMVLRPASRALEPWVPNDFAGHLLHGEIKDAWPSEKILSLPLPPEIKVEGPFPLQPGDWILAASEGILMSQPFSKIEPFFPKLREAADETAEMLFQMASTSYDGDDRTLVLARFQAGDLRRLLADDVTIETSVDRTLTIPMWAAAAVCTLIGALGLWLHRIGIVDLFEE